MIYCRNPDCLHPENPDNNQFCYGCGLDLSITPLFRNRYRVLKILGQGASSRSYYALDLDSMNRSCVIKKIILQAQGEDRQKDQKLFIQEAQKLQTLDHPQIPQLYAYFEQDESCYLVQEYIDGENLFAIYKKQGKFSEEKTWSILKYLLPVLKYIHSQKILHRDIKPENVMKRHHSSQLAEIAQNKLVLVNFGSIKQTGINSGIYTPGYTAMEQMMGQPSPASDLYSLGVICIRLLTGCLPSQDRYLGYQDDLYDVNNACWKWRKKVQQQNINISKKLGNILDKLLEPIVQNRYQSADEVLQDINNPVAAKLRKQVSQEKVLKKDTSFSTVVLSEEELAQFALEQRQHQGPQKFQFEVITVNVKGERIATKTKEAEYLSYDLGQEIILELISIPEGIALIGSPEDELNRSDVDIPQQLMSVAAFYMSKYPITQNQWQAIVHDNPAHFPGGNRPVESISWYEAVKFCQKLSDRIGRECRLPTEIEWEYACRASTTTPFHFGPTLTANLANYDGHCSYGQGPKGVYRQKTVNVGSFPPNAFGLYDMHGLVREWCVDIWQPSYKEEGVIFSSSSTAQSLKTLRGGSWVDHPSFCRSSSRCGLDPHVKNCIVGLRVVC